MRTVATLNTLTDICNYIDILNDSKVIHYLSRASFYDKNNVLIVPKDSNPLKNEGNLYVIGYIRTLDFSSMYPTYRHISKVERYVSKEEMLKNIMTLGDNDTLKNRVCEPNTEYIVFNPQNQDVFIFDNDHKEIECAQSVCISDKSGETIIETIDDSIWEECCNEIEYLRRMMDILSIYKKETSVLLGILNPDINVSKEDDD